MKVLDKDRHNLSNVEVLDWINRSQERFARQKREQKLPKNYTHVTKQIKEHLERKDGPLEDTDANLKTRHKPATIELARILKTAPYELYKGEILMILNHRPRNRDVLATLIEESDSRFEEADLDNILALINEHIGPVTDPSEAQALREQYGLDRPTEAAQATTETPSDATNAKPKPNSKPIKDVEVIPVDALTAAERDALPTDDETDEDYESEEAALRAIAEREAAQNKEGQPDIEDSPLTKWMRELRVRQQR